MTRLMEPKYIRANNRVFKVISISDNTVTANAGFKGCREYAFNINDVEFLAHDDPAFIREVK